MKRLIVTSFLILSMIFTLGFVSNAVAAGRAAGLIVYAGDVSAVALIDFNENQFSQADAQQLTTLLQFGGAVVANLLAGDAPDLSVNLIVITPDQMSAANLGDASTANTFILNHFAALGVDAYIKANVTKVQAPQGVSGQNIRLDLYLYAPTLGVLGSQLTYVGSVEVLESLIQMLGSSLTF